MSRKILFLILLLTVPAMGVDHSCGCGTAANDGISATRGYTQTYLVETPAYSGTADSLVFNARDWWYGGTAGIDTIYGLVFDMDTDSSMKDQIALSKDSALTASGGAAYAHLVVTFNGESISASTPYHIGVTVRGSDYMCRIDLCDDSPGLGQLPGSNFTDDWPLSNPSSAPYDNTAYVPNAVFWYTSSSGGQTVSVMLGKGLCGASHF